MSLSRGSTIIMNVVGVAIVVVVSMCVEATNHSIGNQTIFGNLVNRIDHPILSHSTTRLPNALKFKEWCRYPRFEVAIMARKKIREYDSKRLVKEHYKRISGSELAIRSAQVTESTDLNELIEKEPWLSSSKLVVKPDMLFGKRGKSGLVALNLDLAQVSEFVKARLGKEVNTAAMVLCITIRVFYWYMLYSILLYTEYKFGLLRVKWTTFKLDLTFRGKHNNYDELGYIYICPCIDMHSYFRSNRRKATTGVESCIQIISESKKYEVEMGGCKGPITTFIVEPFVPHNDEFYINIVSERLGCSISFSECGGIDIEENGTRYMGVKTIFLPTGVSLNQEICAPLVATLPLEVSLLVSIPKNVLSMNKEVQFKAIHLHVEVIDLDFTFLEMNPFTLVDGKPYPLDMRGELDDTAAFKNFKKWGNIEFPLPFGRVMSATESFIHGLDEKTSASLKFTVLNPKGRIWTMVAGGGASVIYADTVGDLGFASELGNYAEYSGAPNEEEVLQYARVVIDCATADPDGQKRALVVGGGIANFTDVAATFNGIIRAMKEKESKLKAANMHIYVRRGGPNYQKGLARMRALGDEIGIPIEVYGPEATMTGICKQAIECITAAA
ncbi:hypothetical protein OSB04_008936 [Centaurea solstitialis]|uniref:ATP citrate synthase n=1 Tax=Centaurea solstitialis TaxID=347529 RepID=A0AA38U0G2_9ASTR|nr:hypothetical protein OSB04_008936 [Centaurea solstitialis]